MSLLHTALTPLLHRHANKTKVAKAGVDPTEVTLNSYLAGKRMTLDGATEEKNLGLRRQYESLLTVECTKYSSFDKRRQNDKKIRIIL